MTYAQYGMSMPVLSCCSSPPPRLVLQCVQPAAAPQASVRSIVHSDESTVRQLDRGWWTDTGVLDYERRHRGALVQDLLEHTPGEGEPLQYDVDLRFCGSPETGAV